MVRGVHDDILYSKREVQMLRQEKEQLENVLSHKSMEVRRTLQTEAQRVEDELKRNLAQQKMENVKLQSQIANLKQEKTQLQQNLMGLQRRIGELELSIGANEQQEQ
jgi:chromosome segregation ATPase